MTSRVRDERAEPARADGAPDVDDLVWRLRAGERSALAEAYDRHHQALRSFARRLLGEPEAAEDLVQEVFVRLPRTIRRFEGRSSLRSFLISVAVNECKHHVRSAIRYRRAKQRWGMQRVVEPPPGPAERQRQHEMAALLGRGLDALPIDQRMAFVLCAIEEHTSPEAARLLGVPEATVRSRLARAKKRLRAFVEAEGIR